MSVITTATGTNHLAFHFDRDDDTVTTMCGQVLLNGLVMSTRHTDWWPQMRHRCKLCVQHHRREDLSRD